MDWIATGRQLGAAVKNVQRLRQILAVFAKHGFADVVQRMNLGRYLPKRLISIADSLGDLTTAERLRLSFEELGPTFIKLGQLFSTRPDLFGPEFIDEFVKLQDNVQPLGFSVVKKVVESELNKTIPQAFASFNESPLAAASIAQVHEATLKTGETVVVKVQRPEIEKIIRTDVSLLEFLAGLLEKYVPESKVIGPRVVVDEFFRTLSYELDFIVEANNIIKISENMKVLPDIIIPKVYKNYSTHRVLTLEKLVGVRLTDQEGLTRLGINKKKIVEIGSRAFFRSVMSDGLFHGDLHGGNLFVLPGDKLGIVDFGIVGRLSQKSRDQLVNMVMSLLTEDYENLCYQYAELGSADASIDFEAFQREVRNTLSPYVGLSIADLNVGRILIEATKVAAKYRIKVPGDWMIVFKAILTIEGMARKLDPQFDLLTSGQDLIKDLMKNQYSMQRVTKDLIWVAKDLTALFQILPRQLRWMFKKFNSNDFVFEIKSPDFREIKEQLDQNSKRIGFSVLSAGLLIASSISHQVSRQSGSDFSILTLGYLVAGILLGARILFK